MMVRVSDEPAPPVELSYVTPETTTEEITRRRRPFATSISVRVLCVIYGVVLPIGGLAISYDSYPLGVEWQNGKPLAVLSLIPSGAASVWFLPLLMLGWAAMLCYAIAPTWTARRPIVMLGLATGIVTGLQYCVTQAMAMNDGGSGWPTSFVGLLLAAAGGAGSLGLAWLAERIKLRLWVLLPTLAGAIIVLSFFLGSRAMALFGIPFVLGLLGAAPMAVAGFAVALGNARSLRRADDLALPMQRRWLLPLAGLGWIAAYAGSWALAYRTAQRLYAELPTEPNNCYVVTAANHARLSARFGHQQLRRIKTLELFLAAIAPRSHRRLREIYDTLGPPIARRVRQRRWLAECVYVTLLPVELISGLLGQFVHRRRRSR